MHARMHHTKEAGLTIPGRLFWQEAHLNGAVLESAFSRPAVLITDAGNALHVPPDNRAARDRDFIDAIMATLRANGAPS